MEVNAALWAARGNPYFGGEARRLRCSDLSCTQLEKILITISRLIYTYTDLIQL